MNRGHRLARPLAAIALAAALCAGAAALRGQESPAPASAMALAWKMIADPARARDDVAALAAQTVPLAPDQADRVRQLGREYALEKARLLRELRTTYTGKVREVLDEAQRARYDEVVAALEELSHAEAAARESFAGVLGLDPAQADEVPILGASVAARARLLGIDGATADRIARLREEAYDAERKALMGALDPSRWDDMEEWRQHRKQYEGAAQEAREQYQRQLAELLSPEQLERMKNFETAEEQYRQAIQQARRRAYERLYAALRPAAGGE